MNLPQTITDLLSRLLGLEEAQTIQRYRPSLAAPWAQENPAWLLFGCLALAAASVLFYARYQRHRPVGPRVALAAFRAVVLCLLLLLLAQPILKVTVTSLKRPVLWLLFDGTASMAIADELPQRQRNELAEAVGMTDASDHVDPPGAAGTDRQQPGPGSTAQPAPAARIDYVKALLAREDDNLLTRLAEKYRLKAFLFDRSDGVRSLDPSPQGSDDPDGSHLAGQLTSHGRLTAIGEAIDELGRRHGTGNLAGLVITSDFDQNSGRAALAAAERLGVKIYTVGIGPTAAVNLSVALETRLTAKKDEKLPVTAILRQQGLDGEEVTVMLSARPLDEDQSTADGAADGAADPPSAVPVPIDQKTVTLSAASVPVEFDYVPQQAGRFALVARVDPLAGEAVQQDNQRQRAVTVRDDFLRLLFVEYEPTWEWRFVKEVFHRDKLVGMDGFRTFLRSSDPRVRDSNAMFLPAMAQKRSDFFANDVIFLGDLPASAVSRRFCEMTEEFVRDFGGGLVVLCGPRFGPGELADTPLAKLLPVKVDASAGVFDRQPFRPKLAPGALQYPFMRLGGDDDENLRAWDNLGLLPWYQPVERLHPLATALVEHPSRTCIDGHSLQPLVAIRRYGRGEVVYLGFNETWRMRRGYGELYYRQFWGQMIHRLGLSHALGRQKRFVLSTDRPAYRPADRVLLTVEAYDADFRPLQEEDLPDGRLQGELVLPIEAAAGGAVDDAQPLGISQVRQGLFETRLPVFAGGEYRVRVTDPVTGKPVQTTFKVASVALERHSVVRNVALQRQLADAVAGGKTFDLTTVASLPDQIKLTPKTETSTEIITLWHTWLAFGCVVGLLLGEWLLRKWVNLP